MQDETNAYVYVVKNPAYNDICLAAWDSVLYAGTPVVYETRYGLDLGIVISAATPPGEKYTPGDTNLHGACLAKAEEGDVNASDTPATPEESCAHQCDSCMGCQQGREPERMDIEADMLWLDHLATPSEMARYRENCDKEETALKICREKIKKHNLEMKLITTHFLLGEQKVLFFFTADVRVDFRDLVKDLVSVFKMRIELRQIGVRDESRLIGGLSVCGRDYCCHGITDHLQPVSIKMAKEQNLSLNSVKISGPCGRLLCCLAYEYDYYMEEKSNCPSEGSRLKLDHELWRVSEVNILSRKITVQGSEGRTLYIPFEEVFFNDEAKRWEVSEDWQDEIFGE